MRLEGDLKGDLEGEERLEGDLKDGERCALIPGSFGEPDEPSSVAGAGGLSGTDACPRPPAARRTELRRPRIPPSSGGLLAVDAGEGGLERLPARAAAARRLHSSGR
jgi:hypothetical protein